MPFNLDTLGNVTATRLPDLIVPLKRAPYASTKEDMPQRPYSRNALWPQYFRANQPGLTGQFIRFEFWLATPTALRKYAYNAGVAGTLFDWYSLWNDDQIFGIVPDNPTIGPTKIKNINLQAPYNADKTYPIIQFGANMLQMPTATGATIDAAEGFARKGGFVQYVGVGILNDVLNTELAFYNPTTGLMALMEDMYSNISGFGWFGYIPELRFPSDHTWGFAVRSVGNFRPRIYDFSFGNNFAGSSMAGYFLNLDDATADNLLATVGSSFEYQPTICPGLEGFVMDRAGSTFEGQNPACFWIACDGKSWRNIKLQPDADAQNMINTGGTRILLLDPNGVWWMANSSFSSGQDFTSFGLSQPVSVLQTFPPIGQPRALSRRAYKGGMK